MSQSSGEEMSNDDNKTDLAIIELQGDLKSTENDFTGEFIGDLHFTKTGTPLLIIGNSLLFGKEVALSKPLALMERKINETNTEYLVKSIITKKIIFKTRPKPIEGVSQ